MPSSPRPLHLVPTTGKPQKAFKHLKFLMYLSQSRHMRHLCGALLRRPFSTSPQLIVQVWGSNTGVGKTVVSSGLLKSRSSTSLYLKPVQTGYPQDDDATVVEKHARKKVEAVTLYTYEPPKSPDLAASIEESPLSDETLRHRTSYVLNDFISHSHAGEHRAMALIETAGGVLSPCPSGTTQADVYRPFRFPSLLVGDARLGGISSTLAAYEALKTRGFSVPAVVMFANDAESLSNERSIARHVDRDTEVLLAPSLPPLEIPLDTYLQTQEALEFFEGLNDFLETSEDNRFKSLLDMKENAKQIFWYPFTQHSQLGEITCIDSAHGDHFTCVNKHGYFNTVDGAGSWWTNGVGHGNGKSARAVAAAAGRYGHVMFPEAAHEPAYKLSKRLLQGVGAGWASRVFFSDNGSTAVEVALKMAFRKRIMSAPERKDLPVKIVGLSGSYHGDTLGVMDCSEASDYNSMQTPWYEPRGVFLDPPTVCIKNGVWCVNVPDWIGIPHTVLLESRMEALSSERTVEAYQDAIQQKLDSAVRNENFDLGALVVEPLLLGAGGMKLVDPAFQRTLVSACRKLQIPIVFDEIFTGLWRLGCESGSSLLDCKPDVAAFGKLLTGGTVPLAVTLASEDVFQAFEGSSKREALLHGHSYTAHAVGCSAGIESLSQYEFLKQASAEAPHDYWSEAHARELSAFANVEGVTCIGTVLAVELRSSEAGYASNAARAVVEELNRSGVFARPLGNVIYVMCTPVSTKELCSQVMTLIMRAVESAGSDNAAAVSE